MIKYILQENQYNLDKNLICYFDNKYYKITITHEMFINLDLYRNCTTAAQAAIQQRNQNMFIDNIYHKILEWLNLTENFYPKIQFINDFSPILMNITRPKVETTWTNVRNPIKKEKPKLKVSEDIQDAIELQKFIMKKQKEILKDTDEIRKRRMEYYKKHWTLMEKGVEYMKYILNK